MREIVSAPSLFVTGRNGDAAAEEAKGKPEVRILTQI